MNSLKLKLLTLLCLFIVVFANPSQSRRNFQCGSAGKSISLVVNGTQSERGAWPWLVTLHRIQTNDLFCGGTLISSNVVVTVSHHGL